MSYLKKTNKVIKVGVGIPTPERVHPDFAISNLTEIISYTRKNLPHVELSIRSQGGVRTDRNRNVILKDFIDAQMDYVLWLDADMVYPADIIERYLVDTKGDFDVIGCLYFQRSEPYKPIGYIKKTEDGKFRQLLPQYCHKGEIYKVAGLGYGGMMVKMSTYEKLGEKKWTKYGENFHTPWAETGNLTHDLVFCDDVVETGMEIKLHGSVRPGHIGEKLVAEDDYQEQDNIIIKKYPPTLVIMPATNVDLAMKAANVIKQRAGMPCDVVVVEDKNKIGFIAIANKTVKENPNYVFYVYTAQDAFVGDNWLINAVLKQAKTGAGLVCLNNGRWNGSLAAFGMVERLWMQNNYNGDLFFSGYKSHYADTELTQIAKEQGRYAYEPSSLMIEVDYEKDFGGTKVNLEDKELYAKRKMEVLAIKELQEEFS